MDGLVGACQGTGTASGACRSVLYQDTVAGDERLAQSAELAAAGIPFGNVRWCCHTVRLRNAVHPLKHDPDPVVVHSPNRHSPTFEGGIHPNKIAGEELL